MIYFCAVAAVLFRQAASASPEILLEIQNVRPFPDLPNWNLHFTKIPG